MSEREKLTRDVPDPCDRAKLRRDLFDAVRAETYWLDQIERIALAYAERRVAEAVTEVERICAEWGCNPKFTLLLTNALNPAKGEDK